MARGSLRRADGVTVVSEEDAARLSLLFAPPLPPIAVVPNGADPLHASPPPAAGAPPCGLFVGRMSFTPNREAALFLAREVAPRLPAGRLVVVGSSPPPGLGSLEVAGPVPDLAQLYAAAHAALVPVFSGTGSRMKVAEAALLGVPMVSTRRGVEGYPLTPDVHYLAAETGADFAEALRLLARDPALRERLGAAARTRIAERHTWDAIAPAFVRALEALISRTRG